MCKDRIVFFVAGSLTGLGLVLGYWASPWWFLLSAYVAVNMFQASITGFCPLTKILNAFKVKQCQGVSPLN